MKERKEIRFEDKRSRKIIYTSCCLLNQNRRAPGIAVCGGAISEFVEPLLKREIGIEQLPCLECMGWGGVSRKSIFRILPILFRHGDSKLFPIIKFFGAVWLWNYKRLCKKEAKKAANQMEDYKNSGYEILGVIAMNDSPTCGATKTIDLLGFISKYKKLGIKLEDLEYPGLEKMRELLPKLLVEGQGTFMRELIIELKRKKINTKIIGFDPWHDIKEEAERIKNIILSD